MRTHSRVDACLRTCWLVNGQFWAIQDQILIVRRQAKEKYILLTTFISTSL